MLDFLEKLRKKPVHVKRTILFVSATGITGIIFLVWLSFWAGIYGSANNTAAVLSVGLTPEKASAPSSLLKDNWNSFSDAFQNGFSEIKNQFRF